MSAHVNHLTQTVIGAAMEVHRALGPGLLESAYQECLCRELEVREVAFERERPLPLEYKGIRLECGYRLDLLEPVMNFRGRKAAILLGKRWLCYSIVE